ncbi:MAG: phenylalanine--tRNA ligase subunit beta, partial [Peptococcaceae bacterium]|nr:phenylalanine--tRNA ligase subunit beta [Peptococcaceae bacterium]
MYISYNWLKDYVDIDIPPQELADRLTMIGVAVENVTALGQGVHGVVVGRIESIDPHPGADKLVVTVVDTGSEKLQIVTAATNVSAGDVIPVALEGAVVASGLKIKRAKLRGVESRGMMCSGQELGIDPNTMPAEQAHGIMLLPQDTPLGMDAKEAVGVNDFILELDLTPNRGDCLSVIGVAREVAALTGQPLKLPKPEFPETGEDITGHAKVDIADPELCRRYIARLLRNIRIFPSPSWMQARLRAAGMRPINNIVDVTNYVMLEMGQPLHAFDYDKLAEHHIIVRQAKPGEEMLSLDGTQRKLTPDMLLITDPSGPVCIAGVMGGLDSEITENTTTMLLESAYFHPVSIRRTSKALGLRSEASLRFEKGIDQVGCLAAINRAVQLICDMNAGEAVKGVIDNNIAPAPERTVILRPERVNYVLGIDISKEKVSGILEKLQFAVKDSGDVLSVAIPSYRGDVSIEEDLIEEIARMYGYDIVPSTLPTGLSACGAKTREQVFRTVVADTLAASGINEAITYSFTNPGVFDRMNLEQDNVLRQTINIQNPLSEDHSVMRTMLLPGLLESLAKNFNRRNQDAALFEIGTVFLPESVGDNHQERQILAGAVMGAQPGSWL